MQPVSAVLLKASQTLRGPLSQLRRARCIQVESPGSRPKSRNAFWSATDVLQALVSVGKTLSITLIYLFPRIIEQHQRSFSELAVWLDHYPVSHIILPFFCYSQFKIKSIF